MHRPSFGQAGERWQVQKAVKKKMTLLLPGESSKKAEDLQEWQHSASRSPQSRSKQGSTENTAALLLSHLMTTASHNRPSRFLTPYLFLLSHDVL